MTEATTSSSRRAVKPQALSVHQMMQLMQLEVDRAIEHRYPIACLMIGLDGFADSADRNLRQRLMPLVFGELKVVTFERKVRGLGLTQDDFVLAVFPHVTPEAAVELAEDVLQRGRDLEPPFLPQDRPVTLSIGIGHNVHENEQSFHVLTEDAASGMKVAQSKGGDRHVRWREVESELDRLREELDAQIQEITSHSLEAIADQAALGREWGQGVIDKALGLFDRAPETTDVIRLKKEVVAMLSVEVEDLLRSPVFEELGERERQIEMLERRVRKLTDSLDKTEGELKRIASMKSIDTGIASIYDFVQGLDMSEGNAEQKMEMLTNIFESNFVFQKGESKT